MLIAPSTVTMKLSMFVSVILLLALTEFSFSELDTVNYLIRPNSTTPCPSTVLSYTKCLTLEHFTDEFATTGEVSANTLLHFLPGTHSLSRDLFITNVSSFVMRAVNNNAIVICNSTASLVFEDVAMLGIFHITITECGKESSKFESNLVREYAIITKKLKEIRMLKVAILNSTGSAVMVSNSNSCVINDTTIFGSNGHGVHVSQSIVAFTGDSAISHNKGGGVKTVHSTIHLLGRTVFSSNFAERGGAIRSINSTIVATGRTVFHNNTATTDGGAICSDTGGAIFITGASEFTRNRALYETIPFSLPPYWHGVVLSMRQT